MPQEAEAILRRLNTTNDVRASAWDALYEAPTPADLTAQLRKLPLPDPVRAELWEVGMQRFVAPVSTPMPGAATRDMMPQSTMADARVTATPPTPSMMPGVGENIGGLVGGMTRGRLGAVIGGAAGRGYGELVEHAAEIPGAVRDVARNLGEQPRATLAGAMEGAAEGAKNAGISGARQGALQFAGEGIAAGVGKLAPWLMNRATTRVTAKLARDFPELGDTLIDHALTVSKGGEAKATSLLLTAKAKANAALAAADKAGATVPVSLTPDLAESLKTTVIEAAMKAGKAVAQQGQPLTVATARLDAPTQAFLASVDDALTNGTPLALAPKVADQLKTQLQRESRALYTAMRGPNGVPAITPDAAMRAEFASRLNDALDAVASGYKAANAEARTMIGASRGIAQSTRPSGNLYQAMVRPAVGGVLGGEAGRRQGGTTGAIAGAVTGAALTSPMGMSMAAITLRDPRMQTLLRQMPRATAAALMALMQEEVTPQPAHSPGEPR